MDINFRGAYRAFTVETILSDEITLPERNIIWRTQPKVTAGLADPTEEDIIQITGNALNIVSSRDVRKNVRKSLEIGVDLARGGRRVLYINSYASLETMRQALRMALEREPPAPMEPNPEQAEWPARNFIDHHDAVGKLPASELPFAILDCKMGLWDKCDYTVSRAVYSGHLVGSYADEVEVVTQFQDVVILNSFEFAAVEYRTRLLLVNQLIEWFSKMKITVIVFTQEVKAIMEAGVPVRGPLGLLTSSADSLWKLDQVKKGRNTGVHEHVPNTAVKLYYNKDGNLSRMVYPKGYDGDYGLERPFPNRIEDPLDEGADAVQIMELE